MIEDVKIRFAALCDDSRREDNGKMIFIGMYSQSIIARALPLMAPFCLALWMQAEHDEQGHLEFRILFGDEQEEIASGRGNIAVGAGETVTGIKPIPINVEREGLLRVQLKFGAGEWRNAVSLPLKLRPSSEPSPPASQSPPAASPSS